MGGKPGEAFSGRRKEAEPWLPGAHTCRWLAMPPRGTWEAGRGFGELTPHSGQVGRPSSAPLSSPVPARDGDLLCQESARPRCSHVASRWSHKKQLPLLFPLFLFFLSLHFLPFSFSLPSSLFPFPLSYFLLSPSLICSRSLTRFYPPLIRPPPSPCASAGPHTLF